MIQRLQLQLTPNHKSIAVSFLLESKKMCIHLLQNILTTLFFFCHILTTVSTQNIAVSCSSHGNSTALDGRIWIGDSSSRLQITGKSSNTRAINRLSSQDSIPYKTARASRQQFTYVFSVEPGQKFIRLHFNQDSYTGFKRSKPSFTVKAGPYTLLTNFSPATSPLKKIVKEYCVNTDKNRALTITFTPSQNKFKSDDFYAFVNGIEVVSMPTGLYFTPEGDSGSLVVGKKHRFYIDTNTALELVQRLNIGGNPISSSEDSSMFRTWDDDSNYLSGTGSVSVANSIYADYTNTPTYTAPIKIYQTERKTIKGDNLTWNIPVDPGFRYLIRLHFSEFQLRIDGHKDFPILINNHIGEDITFVEKGTKSGVPVYTDYIVMIEGDKMAGKRDLTITFKPSIDIQFSGTMNGLEVFKLSNPDNNLAGLEEVPKPKKLRKNESSSPYSAILNPTVLTVIMTLLNIAVHNLARLNSPRSKIRRLSTEHQCRQFSIDEIKSSTDNFNPRFHIGSGGYGHVYKGSIDDGSTEVAIKRSRLGSESRHEDTQFWTEIKMLSNIRHRHLVSLIGYCNDGDERALVYQYMARGTLADHLHKINRLNPPLSWELRLKISIGAASGLYYLHSRHRVIHRDVKSSNILLDEDWTAKISDFGLCKMGPLNDSFTGISTNVKGTFGYLDPEYYMTRKLTRKSDVYAFGVVLFEVLSGRPAVDMRLEEEQHSLGMWARYCIREGKVDLLIDQNLIGQITPACMKVFVGIAGRCLHSKPQGRPAMADVVKALELALVLQQTTDPTDQIEEEENPGLIYSDQSNGMISPIDDMSLTTSTGESDSFATEDNNLTGNSTATDDNNPTRGRIRSRWWRDFFGISPRTQSESAFPRQAVFRKYSFMKIQKATDNFDDSHIIGYGDHEIVYQGFIDNGPKAVTIRRSRSRDSRFHMERELQFRKQMQEKPWPEGQDHVASLIGYCKTTIMWELGKLEEEMIFVYEHAANGTLHDHLHQPFRDPLPWKLRLQISIGAARGILQIQSSAIQTKLQRDLRSTNIWLDENWVPKVYIWGFSKNKRINPELGNVGGDWGHLESVLTQKSYVYSFGFILFELLFADRESDRWFDKDQLIRALWIKSCLSNNPSDSIDPFLVGRISPDSLKIYIEIAGKCLLDYGNDRPSMADILTQLQDALKQQEAMDGNASSNRTDLSKTLTTTLTDYS